MTTSGSNPIREPFYEGHFERKEEDTPPTTIEKVVETHTSLTNRPPMERGEISRLLRSSDVKLRKDVFDSESETSTGKLDPFKLKTRPSKTKGPKEAFYQGKGYVIMVQMETPNGTFLLPQSKEQWQKIDHSMSSIESTIPYTDLKKGFSVDLTTESVIFKKQGGKEGEKEVALHYTPFAAVTKITDNLRYSIEKESEITILKDSSRVLELKKRKITMLNEPTVAEVLVKGAKRAMSATKNLFGIKESKKATGTTSEPEEEFSESELFSEENEPEQALERHKRPTNPEQSPSDED
jgi:hypothetical protein